MRLGFEDPQNINGLCMVIQSQLDQPKYSIESIVSKSFHFIKEAALFHHDNLPSLRSILDMFSRVSTRDTDNLSAKWMNANGMKSVLGILSKCPGIDRRSIMFLLTRMESVMSLNDENPINFDARSGLFEPQGGMRPHYSQGGMSPYYSFSDAQSDSSVSDFRERRSSSGSSYPSSERRSSYSPLRFGSQSGSESNSFTFFFFF
jgi:hypothetical protein